MSTLPTTPPADGPTAVIIDLPVLGMTCAACVRRVERAISALPGVRRTDVNLLLSRVRVEAEPGVTVADAAHAVRDAGYEIPRDALEPQPDAGARLASTTRGAADEVAGLGREAALALALAGPLVALAMIHTSASVASVVTQLVLGSALVLGPGRRMLLLGMRAVRHRSPDMNTLIALGVMAAWSYSTVGALRWLVAADDRHLGPQLYFEAAGAIIAFVLLGKWLERTARARVTDAVHALLSLAPPRAHRLRDDLEEDVDATLLVPGDTISIRPGELVPADATVLDGASTIDESTLTGESMPVDKDPGTAIYAGTLNQHGVLTARVARAGDATAIAKIARAVEDAQGTKAPIARLADRISAVFVPIVLVIAAGTCVTWLVIGAAFGSALERAIAVLVIACPCALGLATPAAIAVGATRGAALGILYRTGSALEIASSISVVALDKTGTLTLARPTVLAIVPAGSFSALELLRLAGSLEQGSEHPLARAVVDEARRRDVALTPPSTVVVTPGSGMTGSVEGRHVGAGTRAHLDVLGVDVPEPSAPANATSRVLVSVDGTYAGHLELADPISPDAADAVSGLRALGIDVVMITGDRAEAATPVATAAGISDVRAEVTPVGKAAAIAALRSARPGSRVAMVGDGVNDAPALAAADLGIAIGSGTEIAVAASDVTLLRGGIAALPTALALARATFRTIRRNLALAFGYNVVCIPIAAGVLAPVTGWQLSPVVASAAMSLSSVSVVLSSLALRRWSPRSG